MTTPINQYDCGNITFYLTGQTILFSVNVGKKSQQNFIIQSPMSVRHRSLAKMRRRIASGSISNLDELSRHTYPDLMWVPTQIKL